MTLLLLSVGRPRDRRLAELHDDYAARLRRFRIPYESRFVPETRSGAAFDDDHVREREGRALLAAVPAGSRIVALDRTGRLLDSPALARRLESWSSGSVAFLVGGPLGIRTEALEDAHLVWSLSPLTFPHELVRVLVAEQVYRAVTILRGVPYHK